MLEAVGASLSLFEELNHSQSLADDFRYTPFVLCGGQPRLDIKPEQLCILVSNAVRLQKLWV